MNTTSNPKSPPIEDRTSKREQLVEQLRRFMGGDMQCVNLWLNSPHPYLDNHTPESLLDEGELDTVEYLAWAMETGQPW